MNFKCIDKIGIEIEGGWATAPTGMGYDGSVRTEAAVNGEMVSRPCARLSDATAWLLSIYPTSVNASCGLHVHLSFKNHADYCRLMDVRFESLFFGRMEMWGKAKAISNKEFYRRMKGDNSMCKKEWNADMQVLQTSKSLARYTHWNFCYSFHGTAECRMLPSFKTPSIAVAAVEELVKIVEDYLALAPVAIAFESKEEDDESESMPQVMEEKI